MEKRPIVLIAAVADNNVIGDDNRLIWRLKSDLRHFRNLTLGRPVLMGRRTFLSIGKPLPGRGGAPHACLETATCVELAGPATQRSRPDGRWRDGPTKVRTRQTSGGKRVRRRRLDPGSGGPRSCGSGSGRLYRGVQGARDSRRQR